jgi:hypothetical protein
MRDKILQSDSNDKDESGDENKPGPSPPHVTKRGPPATAAPNPGIARKADVSITITNMPAYVFMPKCPGERIRVVGAY